MTAWLTKLTPIKLCTKVSHLTKSLWYNLLSSTDTNSLLPQMSPFKLIKILNARISGIWKKTSSSKFCVKWSSTRTERECRWLLSTTRTASANSFARERTTSSRSGCLRGKTLGGPRRSCKIRRSKGTGPCLWRWGCWTRRRSTVFLRTANRLKRWWRQGSRS